ncbi:MAG: GNAT family N-acetyltransferase [Alphaproteobacteria bacterium]|nr:GNAT family N-acetyltransferase [Alphaproteobacteria bacterium]
MASTRQEYARAAAPHTISTGVMGKTDQPYSVVIQTKADIDAMLHLQHTVLDTLPDDKKNFIVPKDRAYLEEHIDNGSVVIGILCNGQLIAQSLLKLPNEEHPETGMTGMQLNAAPDNVSIIQGVLVDPAYRGNGLMSVMIESCLRMAEATGREHIMARADTRNAASWAAFITEGFELDSIDSSPKGRDVYNLHGNTTALMAHRRRMAFNSQAPAADSALPVPADDLQRQRGLLSAGFKGVAFDRTQSTLSFTARNAPAPL